MTQEEILDFNKRCAEFLGKIVVPAGTKPIGQIRQPEVSEALLFYDSDWNCIMEIVEAIESIKHKTSGEPIYRLAISNRVCKIDTVNDEIVWAKAKTKKEAVVSAINQFLIWYMNKELTYPGYMSKESIEFFGNKLTREERDGCAVVGHFVQLEDGKTVMPSKGDVFTKNEEGKIKLI